MTVGRGSAPRLFACLLLLAGVAACAASEPARTFTLVSRPGAQHEHALSALAVRPVEFPKYLDRPQLVRRSDPYELRMSEFERWGEGMGDMITRVLIDDLAIRLPRTQVFPSSGAFAPPSDTTLQVSISRFETEPSGTVALTAQWQFQGGDRRRPQLQSADIRVDGTPDDKPTQLVAAMSDALAQLSDRIAASAGAAAPKR